MATTAVQPKPRPRKTSKSPVQPVSGAQPLVIGYGVPNKTLPKSHKIHAFVSVSISVVIGIMLIALLSSMLVRWYDEYYTTKSNTSKKINVLSEDLAATKFKYDQEITELRNLVLGYQITELERRLNNGSADADDKATLIILRDKKQSQVLANKKKADLANGKDVSPPPIGSTVTPAPTPPVLTPALPN